MVLLPGRRLRRTSGDAGLAGQSALPQRAVADTRAGAGRARHRAQTTVHLVLQEPDPAAGGRARPDGSARGPGGRAVLAARAAAHGMGRTRPAALSESTFGVGGKEL